MVDRRFFHYAGPATLQEIEALTGAVAQNADKSLSFSDVAPLDKADGSHISFLDNVKYLDDFANSKAGACFVRAKFAARAPQGMILLITETPYLAFAQTSGNFYPPQKPETYISPQATIASTAKIGKNVLIKAGVHIGDNVVIGDGCAIGHNSIIDAAVEIGEGSVIGALCTISHALIGKRCILHRGIHIGQDGFGFAPSPTGIVKVPQLGRVVLGDDVEIGSGTCIDRGSGPDTTIGSGSKIDNLVQIGHNVTIGRFVVMAAQCGIAGSSIIGDGAMVGGQVGLSGHVSIGAGAKLAAQAGIMTDVPAGATYGGSPAVTIKDWHRQTVALAALTKRKAAANE